MYLRPSGVRLAASLCRSSASDAPSHVSPTGASSCSDSSTRAPRSAAVGAGHAGPGSRSEEATSASRLSPRKAGITQLIEIPTQRALARARVAYHLQQLPHAERPSRSLECP